MGGGDGEGFLEGEGRFDHGGDEAGGDVPFYVAVEEPDAWIDGSVSWGIGGGRGEGALIRVVGSESQYHVSVWAHHDCIPPHWDGGECLVAYVVAGVVG